MNRLLKASLSGAAVLGFASVALATDINSTKTAMDPHVDPHFDVAAELSGDFLTQMAQSSKKCYVDRIRGEWEAAGKPKVKGWAEDVSDDEAEAAYNCIKADLASRYDKSDEPGAKGYQSYTRYNTVAYPSDTHGGRLVNNFGDATAANYGKFEEFGSMPVGSILVKDSFGVNKRGEVRPGPLFTMVKMEAGFNEESADWRYALITPKAKLMGATNGDNGKKVQFCISCHAAAEEFDQMFFLPDDYRVSN